MSLRQMEAELKQRCSKSRSPSPKRSDSVKAKGLDNWFQRWNGYYEALAAGAPIGEDATESVSREARPSADRAASEEPLGHNSSGRGLTAVQLALEKRKRSLLDLDEALRALPDISTGAKPASPSISSKLPPAVEMWVGTASEATEGEATPPSLGGKFRIPASVDVAAAVQRTLYTKEPRNQSCPPPRGRITLPSRTVYMQPPSSDSVPLLPANITRLRPSFSRTVSGSSSHSVLMGPSFSGSYDGSRRGSKGSVDINVADMKGSSISQSLAESKGSQVASEDEADLERRKNEVSALLEGLAADCKNSYELAAKGNDEGSPDDESVNAAFYEAAPQSASTPTNLPGSPGWNTPLRCIAGKFPGFSSKATLPLGDWLQNLFDAADSDHDGVVTRQEFLDALREGLSSVQQPLPPLPASTGWSYESAPGISLSGASANGTQASPNMQVRRTSQVASPLLAAGGGGGSLSAVPQRSPAAASSRTATPARAPRVVQQGSPKLGRRGLVQQPLAVGSSSPAGETRDDAVGATELESEGAIRCQDLVVGARVEAKYEDEWYIGTLQALPGDDQQGRWAVQCDCDQEGLLLYASSVKLLQTATPCVSGSTSTTICRGRSISMPPPVAEHNDTYSGIGASPLAMTTKIGKSSLRAASNEPARYPTFRSANVLSSSSTPGVPLTQAQAEEMAKLCYTQGVGGIPFTAEQQPRRGAIRPAAAARACSMNAASCSPEPPQRLDLRYSAQAVPSTSAIVSSPARPRRGSAGMLSASNVTSSVTSPATSVALPLSIKAPNAVPSTEKLAAGVGAAQSNLSANPLLFGSLFTSPC